MLLLPNAPMNGGLRIGEVAKRALLFAPGIEWKDQPPTPSFWMHQLYSVDPKNAFDSKATRGRGTKVT